MRLRPGVLISYGNTYSPTQSQRCSRISYHLPGQWVELFLRLLTKVQLFEGSGLIKGSSFQLPVFHGLKALSPVSRHSNIAPILRDISGSFNCFSSPPSWLPWCQYLPLLLLFWVLCIPDGLKFPFLF